MISGNKKKSCNKLKSNLTVVGKISVDHMYTALYEIFAKNFPPTPIATLIQEKPLK